MTKVATWNIRAGGGKRTAQIAESILYERADVLVLTEFRKVPGRKLLDLIAPLGYEVLAGDVEGPHNCTCVLAKFPMTRVFEPVAPASHHRWVSAHVPSLDLFVLGVHIPNQSEVWNKAEFWTCVESYAARMAGRRSIIIGDLNTALDEDCEGDPIRAAAHF